MRYLVKRYYINGNLKGQGFFHGTKRDGSFIYYYPDGSKVFGKDHFKNDLLNGKSVTFYENGKVEKIMYFNMGKEASTWKTFDSTGHLIDSTVYK